MTSSFETLVYRILGKTISQKLVLDSYEGSTYNFLTSYHYQPVQETVGAKAVKISPADAITEIITLAQKPAALSENKVRDLYDFFQLVFKKDAKNLNVEAIANRELKVRLLADLPNVDIKSDIVYNVLFYLWTGKTTYVRTRRTYRMILTDENHGKINHFVEKHVEVLAKYYRRNRNLLLYLKKTPLVNNTTINYISKRSRKVNQPTHNKVFKAVSYDKKPTTELLKMLGASNIIHVRNGRTYEVKNRAKEPYDHEKILAALADRKDIFTDVQTRLSHNGWTLALPISDKQALGPLPNGSFRQLEIGEQIGLRWYMEMNEDLDEYDTHVDLDLSFSVPGEKYGWNGRSKGLVTYSGDMTRMDLVGPNLYSAQETFVFNKNIKYGVLDVASYSGYDNSTKVDLIVGDELIPIQMPHSSIVLAIVIDNCLYVYNNGDNQLGTQVTSPNALVEAKMQPQANYL